MEKHRNKKLPKRPNAEALYKCLYGTVKAGYTAEHEIGCQYIETEYPQYKLALQSSRKFWNWFRQQQENLAKFILSDLGIRKPVVNSKGCSVYEIDHNIGSVEKEAMQDAYNYYQRKAKAYPKYLTKPLIDLIIKNYQLEKEFLNKPVTHL